MHRMWVDGVSFRWSSARRPRLDLLGGRLRATVPVTHSIGLLSVKEAAEEAAKVVAAGITTIKVKIGFDPKCDIEVVGAVRATAGNEVEICIYANEGYKTRGEAISTIRAMEKFTLKYVEQPVMGIERLADVARAIDPPVMADESAWNAHDVIQIIERQRDALSRPQERSAWPDLSALNARSHNIGIAADGGVRIAWDNGKDQLFHHNNMTEVEVAKANLQ